MHTLTSEQPKQVIPVLNRHCPPQALLRPLVNTVARLPRMHVVVIASGFEMGQIPVVVYRLEHLLVLQVLAAIVESLHLARTVTDVIHGALGVAGTRPVGPPELNIRNKYKRRFIRIVQRQKIIDSRKTCYLIKVESR